MINKITITRDGKKFTEKNGIVQYENNGRLRLWLNPKDGQPIYDYQPIIEERPDVNVVEWEGEADAIIDLPSDLFSDMLPEQPITITPFDDEKHMVIPERLRRKAEWLFIDDLMEKTVHDEIRWEVGDHSYVAYENDKMVCMMDTPDLIVGWPPMAHIWYENQSMNLPCNHDKLWILLNTIHRHNKLEPFHFPKNDNHEG